MNIITNFITALRLDASDIWNSPVYLIAILAMMTFASYTDIRYMKIYNKFNLVVLVSRILISYFNPMTFADIFSGAILFAMVLIVGMINLKNDIGGDIKFAGVFGLWAGLYIGIISFAVGIIILIPMSLIKKKAIPLAPFIQLGFVITLLSLIFVF